ncbi:MAG: DUF1622 domain-containing protein [Pirellulaceae bacterium]
MSGYVALPANSTQAHWTVLIGLEVLVAVTIIKTITMEPACEGIAFLAIMVAIRTALGWTMVLEMNGHWPWQGSKKLLDFDRITVTT